MRRVITTSALMICLVILVVLSISAQEPSQFSTLFQQLQDPKASDGAAKQFLKLGRTSPEAKKYLATHLPTVIERGPTDSTYDTNTHIWGNAVRMAGDLKIAEAAPALAKWISFNTGAGAFTFSQVARLEYNPAAKALARIGDPAVPTLSNLLRVGNLDDRYAAVMALNLVNSSTATNALAAHLDQEPDPNLKTFIQKILAK